MIGLGIVTVVLLVVVGLVLDPLKDVMLGRAQPPEQLADLIAVLEAGLELPPLGRCHGHVELA